MKDLLDLIEEEDNKIPRDVTILYFDTNEIKIDKEDARRINLWDVVGDPENPMNFGRTPGIAFDKVKFRELLIRLKDPNLKKGGTMGYNYTWHQIIQDFYFPLVRHIAAKMNINNNVELLDVCNRMWEKTDKFDVSRNTSPLAYFWQMAFCELRTLNNKANMVPIRVSAIVVNELFETEEERDELRSQLESDNNYIVLSANKTRRDKFLITYQLTDPVIYETEDIEDETDMLNSMILEKNIYVSHDEIIEAIQDQAPMERIGDLSFQFYKFITEDQEISKLSRVTQIWKRFMEEYKTGKITLQERALIMGTLKVAVREILKEHDNE